MHVNALLDIVMAGCEERRKEMVNVVLRRFVFRDPTGVSPFPHVYLSLCCVDVVANTF